MENSKALIAELLGSFVLLFFGGMTVIAGGNIIAIAFGFGLALLAGLYAFGERSGGHFNPAVSLGALLDKRIDAATFTGYVVAQVVGYLLAGLALLIASSQAAVAATATVRAETVEVASGFLIEILLTAVFVAVILRVTKSESFGSSALIAIPLTLIAIHLAAATVTGASVNPARSLGSAVFGNNWTDAAVWLIAPMIGAVVGWFLYRVVHE